MTNLSNLTDAEVAELKHCIDEAGQIIGGAVDCEAVQLQEGPCDTTRAVSGNLNLRLCDCNASELEELEKHLNRIGEFCGGAWEIGPVIVTDHLK